MITGYQTGDVAIATMLFTLGVGWWKDDDGKEIPCFCQYDIDTLGKLAAKELPELKGMDIVEGAKLAHRRGKKGNVRYNFERNELFDRLISSWKKHNEWMMTQDKLNHGEGTANMQFPEIEPEIAARLFCQWSKNRRAIANLWRGAVPDVVIEGPSRTAMEPMTGPKGESGERTVRSGSLKVMSVNASHETRERMGI